jgi:hypothetical protein
MSETSTDIGIWLLVISLIPAIAGLMTWSNAKLSAPLFGIAVGLASGAIFVLAF